MSKLKETNENPIDETFQALCDVGEYELAIFYLSEKAPKKDICDMVTAKFVLRDGPPEDPGDDLPGNLTVDECVEWLIKKQEYEIYMMLKKPSSGIIPCDDILGVFRSLNEDVKRD